MTMLEAFQRKMAIVRLFLDCDEMAEHGASPKAIVEMLRIACQEYGNTAIVNSLAKDKKLMAYLQK